MAREQKIIVVMAAFNGARHLAEQLDSLASQSHKNWELIVSDDGSTDGTLGVVEKFANLVPQKITVVEGPGQGFWRNFLSPLRRSFGADGDLFAFSDQDDIWFADKLKRAADWFSTNPDEIPALYFTRTELVSSDGTSLGCSPLFKRKASFQNALVQNIGGGNTMVFNRSAKLLLAQTPEVVTLVSHDWWAYQLITGAGGRAFYDPEPSLKYRQHARNLVGSNRGLRQRLARLTALATRRFKNWNEINIGALTQMRHLLSKQAITTLQCFRSARQSTFPKNLYWLWRSGVHRQGRIETIGMYLGLMFGLI